MKKYLVLFLVASLGLAACSSKEEPTGESTSTVKKQVETEKPEKETPVPTKEKETTSPKEPTASAEESNETDSPTSTAPVAKTPTETVKSQPTQQPEQPKAPVVSTPSVVKQYSNRTFTGKDGEGYTYSMYLTLKDEKSGVFTLTVTEDKTGQLSEKLSNVAFTLDNNLNGLFTYTADQTADKFDGGSGGIKLSNNTVEFGRYRFSIILR